MNCHFFPICLWMITNFFHIFLWMTTTLAFSKSYYKILI
jgi:hypothetical protein